MRIFISSVCGFVVLALVTVAQAQSVRTVTFRIPVEVENIRYLTSVRAECRIQDGTNWTNAHTIHKRIAVHIIDGLTPVCTAEPRTEDAEYRCAETSEEGKSWSNIIDISVRDYEGGGIRITDGEHFRCNVDVNYDTEPESAGEATLNDGLCAGFFDNPWSITARERYQTYTGGDITAAGLCGGGNLDTSLDLIDMPLFYIRGGECCEEIDETPPPEAPPAEPPVVVVPNLPLPLPQSPLPPNTTTLPIPNTQACADAVQGKIAWDYKGSKQWAKSNIDRLCAGATSSTEPAQCFDRVMHGGVSWGGGTQWAWANAIDLCEGTPNADATVACFETAINGGTNWRAAINQCDAQP